MTTYNSVLLVKQAYPVANFDISNVFPITGDTITLTNTSSDYDSIEWTTNTGNATDNPTTQSADVVIETTDKVEQSLEITNSVGVLTKTKNVYGLAPPQEAYYTFTVSEPVIREGESFTVYLNNLYNFTDPHTVQIIVTDSDTGVVAHDIMTSNSQETFSMSTRGAYDVEVIVDSGTSTVIQNKQGRIVTVSKALADIGDAVIVNLLNTEDSDSVTGSEVNMIEGTGIAAGSTIVLRKNAADPIGSKYRLRVEDLVGTEQDPIIITIDSTEQFVLSFESYWGLLMLGCEHVIIDGKGYNNLSKGLKITPYEPFEGTICLQMGDLSTNIEVFEVELSECGFAGVSAKTDPKANYPESWRGNFSMKDLRIHNTYIHNTAGEGVYLGYFSASTKTGVNDQGVTVTYRPHAMEDCKLYRNVFESCGWDSIQLNNATGASEIAYNTIINSAAFGEPNQNTGMSVTIEGSIHDNIIDGCNGLGIQVGFLGATDIYNNVVSGLPDGSMALFFLSDSSVPEQNVNGTMANQIPVTIYNNTLITEGRAYTVSGQNVAQYENISFFNNFMNPGASSAFTGQAAATVALWESNSANNVIFNPASVDQYKQGSIEDANFNIYPNSILAKGGSLVGYMYDVRGFKNWYTTDKFRGSYAGVVKINDSILNLVDFTINSGDSSTNSRSITFTYEVVGSPTHFMLSEDPTFTGAVWQEITDPLTFTTSSGEGIKTVYFKLKNSSVESNELYDSITYNETRRVLLNLSTSNPSYDVAAPWNNFRIEGSFAANGLSIANLTDQYGDVTTLGAEVVSAFDDYESNMYQFDPLTSLYEEDAVHYKWQILRDGSTTGIGTIKITGCDDNKLYNVYGYAYRYSGGDMTVEVQGVEQTYNYSQNTQDSVAVFQNVQSVGGEILVSIKTAPTGVSYGAILSLLDISEFGKNPIITGFVLNGDAVSTTSPNLNITMTTERTVTEYMISEDPAFAGASWQSYTGGSFQYTLTDQSAGTKVVYAKIRNTEAESAVVSDAIELIVP
jgi:hypothetical protein